MGGGLGRINQGKRVAQHVRIPVMEFSANWGFQGLAAGPIRNSMMLKYGKPDLVLAFHLNIKKSKGTADMVRKAKKAGVEVRIIK